ncbi:MAG: ABC transporter substrate-binding protein [Gammaproteobacteria bacterium]|nr:ABC transporter substrate-binding protein [Gammaproteobacteria bacterium]MDH5651980.1 ABC transporter substrate-binding protein [Gammaproteobacteria bacterium]
MNKDFGRRLVLCVFSVLITTTVAAAPKYISSPSLDKVINTPVGKVQSGQEVNVPIITWGADIRTIYANGNSSSTTSNSIFGKLGLKLKLQRVDVFRQQVEDYLSGKSPYLRGTLGMINMAAEVTSRDGRTKPIIIYQLSESAGGDALVVKPGIRRTKDLRGKTIALQAYGPHVDYLAQVLADAGLGMADVNLKWLPDLTGSDNTPMAAFYEKDIDAAMVIIPDALALTSGGNVGTGSEDSVRGARILLSTKTANKVIADVYAVRADYFDQHRDEVQKFVHGLMKAQEKVHAVSKNKNSAEFRDMMQAGAGLLLDSKQAVSDTEALYADADHVGYKGNIKFFTDKHYPRNFDRRNNSIQRAFKSIGLVARNTPLQHAGWNYPKLRAGLAATSGPEQPRFHQDKVNKVVTTRQQQGRLDEGALISFEVYFKPNQKSFTPDHYSKEFDRVIELASTYGGAVITVEGHSDPLGYLRKKKTGANSIVLRQITQSAKNLSYTRAAEVRDSIINYAKSKQVILDTSQFALVGHGISAPKNGLCGSDPCAPKNENEWRANMRVEFRLIQIEAESEVFKPL